MSNDDWDDTVAALPGEINTDPGPSQAYLVVVRGSNVGASYPVTGPAMVIGRGAGADLRVNDEGVSRFHCKLHHQQAGILVEDLGSRNGTYCNGERVSPGMRVLVEGDRLQIGTTFVFRFTYVENAADVTAPIPPIEMHDVLTGASSRRHFMDRLETEVSAALGRRSALSLVLVHTDRFAEIAADFGQGALDQVLVAVAAEIRDNTRKDDVLGRIGPGDFALISLWASPGDTFMFAERLRKRADRVAPGVVAVPITLSLGIAAMSELNIQSAHDLLVAAGSALHRARSQGGNRSVLCTPELVRDSRSRATV